MSKILVIVESPGKIKKINEYLGSSYIVKASFGHIQDLDKKTLSIDVENNFTPFYIVSPDKSKVVKELKDLTRDCKDVILASDEDREGEAIAGSLKDVLKLKEPKRIVFHEITKKAISEAIENPRTLNQDLIDAQQARRLLDRLMGYKISPILWTYKVGESAGRVQSVVVRILVDKEKEIENAISEPFLKTTAEFSIKDSKFNGTLTYQFKLIDDAKNFLSTIDKECIYKVVNVENKKSVRKPSAPFITSTLQQDASTKMGFAVKRTMDAAQKLYEAGLITYMRTDSTNLSEDALKACEKYIKSNFGKEYSDVKTYSAKSKGAQEAHEAIRPTHIDKDHTDELEGDCQKLYSLIWKRTVASQMANAKVNVQNIFIDIEKDKKSLLLFSKKQYHFVSTLENIEFDGFLKLYDNSNEEDSENVTGKIEVKEKDFVDMSKIRVNEEYTKLPLRFNEAGLIKFLEKNGIGRPSTYASIINKIIDKKYVEIKNIDGVKKDSKCLELSNVTIEKNNIKKKKIEIKESTKEIRVGKENKKLVPTEIGNQIVEFLLKNFEPIMDIKFTADFEEYLDKIAEGKAKWFNILNQFYQLFNPICIKLSKDVKKDPTLVNTDKLIGIEEETGLEIYSGEGKYGPYVKRLENEQSTKWKYASIKNDEITLEDAILLLKYPIDLGTFHKKNVYLYKGQYGLYVKYGDKNISVKDKNENEIDLDSIKHLLEGGDKYAVKSFTVKNKIINVKNGQYGPFIQVVSGKNKTNIPIPKDYDIETIHLEDVLTIIGDKNGTQKPTEDIKKIQSTDTKKVKPTKKKDLDV
jgi:DNA topoisomerase-1